jgi:hypothetical protein
VTTYRGAEGYSGSLRCFNCVHIQVLLGSFPHVSGVCSVFFSDVVSDGGKSSYVCCIVFCMGYHVFLLLGSGCSPSAVLFVHYAHTVYLYDNGDYFAKQH